jgi:hypothetical protein
LSPVDPGFLIPDKLNEKGEELLDDIKLLSLITEVLSSGQIIVPKVLEHDGDCITLGCAELDHCVGKLAVMYPFEGNTIDGFIVNAYWEKVDICNVVGIPVQTILVG